MLYGRKLSLLIPCIMTLEKRAMYEKQRQGWSLQSCAANQGLRIAKEKQDQEAFKSPSMSISKQCLALQCLARKVARNHCWEGAGWCCLGFSMTSGRKACTEMRYFTQAARPARVDWASEVRHDIKPWSLMSYPALAAHRRCADHKPYLGCSVSPTKA